VQHVAARQLTFPAETTSRVEASSKAWRAMSRLKRVHLSRCRQGFPIHVVFYRAENVLVLRAGIPFAPRALTELAPRARRAMPRTLKPSSENRHRGIQRTPKRHDAYRASDVVRVPSIVIKATLKLIRPGPGGCAFN
jgi:hypothetical protein